MLTIGVRRNVLAGVYVAVAGVDFALRLASVRANDVCVFDAADAAFEEPTCYHLSREACDAHGNDSGCGNRIDMPHPRVMQVAIASLLDH